MHKEAYCLMTYRGDCGMEETLWNAYDGPAPFIIDCVCGDATCKARHVNWNQDVRKQDFNPSPGTRIFVQVGDNIVVKKV